ncbi:MAG: hypothetical protein GWM98_00910 [Nitrospinaceae bacterium]|nr:hypothetical protein [Nitrospinaceae bacterium]
MERKFSYSMVTYYGGTSYSVGGMRFPKNQPRRVTSAKLRKKLEGVKGFQFDDHYVDAPAGPPVSEPEPEPAPAPKAKVKTVKKKKRTVKKVRPKGDS